MDCLDLFALNVPPLAHFNTMYFVIKASHSAHRPLEPEGLPPLVVLIRNLHALHKTKTPGDGFEPPLEEPESSVLPLDDPGLLYVSILLQIKKVRNKKLRTSIF